MSIEKDIPDLIKANIISGETGDKIREYYKNKTSPSTGRLFIIFGILGAILTGLGIILIIAHNWDELSTPVKTSFAFLPLVLGQILCAFTILKKRDSVAWRESSSAFLFFAVGAAIALVSQIYHMNGNLADFLLTWMILCLPLIYLMNSSITSLLFIAGITYYSTELGYFSYPSHKPFMYLILLGTALPHYYLIYKKQPESNFVTFHHWVIPISLTIALGTAADHYERLMYVAYMSLFGLFYLLGNSELLKQQKVRNNGYRVIGYLGLLCLLFNLSFDWFWENVRTKYFPLNQVLIAPEFYFSILISVAATIVFYIQVRGKSFREIKPLAPVFLCFTLIFMIGLYSLAAVALINVLILAIGILTIRQGALQDHLGVLNSGLVIITILVLCRFFDSDLSFIIRGLLFIGVGAGFFAANYFTLKKRKINA